MKSGGGPVAVAIAAGYLLGRGHRLRWALALGAAASVGRLGGRGGLRHAGAEALRAAPELARFAAAGRPLVSAGRAALKAAADSRVEAWAGRLDQATEVLRRPDGADVTAGRSSAETRRRHPGGRAADTGTAGDSGEEFEDGFDDEDDVDDEDRLDDDSGEADVDAAPGDGSDGPDTDESDDESDDGPDGDPDDEADGAGSNDDEFDGGHDARSGRGRPAGDAARRRRAAGPPRQRADAGDIEDEDTADGDPDDGGARRGGAVRRPAVSRSSNGDGRPTVRRGRK